MKIPEPRCMLCQEPVTAEDRWKRWRAGIAHEACVRREKRRQKEAIPRDGDLSWLEAWK